MVSAKLFAEIDVKLRGLVRQIGTQKHAKGQMDDAYSAHDVTGRLFGCEGLHGHKAKLITIGTQEVITRKLADLEPLDEHVLLARGIEGGAVADAETQVDIEQLPALTRTVQPARAPAATSTWRSSR